MPLVVGAVVLVLGMLVLLASVFVPRWFPAEAREAIPLSQEAKEEVKEVEAAASSSTTAVSGSFVLRTRDRLLSEGADFVEADLTAMNIKVYQAGKEVVNVPIKGKGKIGSWWETPVGVYSVKNKTENHFSSFGHVYQPWSIVFQGNYFIHGWPYYPDGTPVSTTYSGGCIRLADEDAKAIYDAVEMGTPVLVYKEPAQSAPLPEFAGDPGMDGNFTVIDVPTGEVIVTRDANSDTTFGSPINLLTALTAVDYINIERDVTVGAATGSARLAPVSSASMLDLLRLMLSEGDVEAARTIASVRGEATFVRYMNAKAEAIGMNDTRVVSVDFDDEGNRTTAADLALLTRYLAENRSFVLQLTRDARGNLAYDPPAWDDLRFNESLRGLPGFFGGTAQEGTGEPAVAVVTVGTGDQKRQVAIAVTGSRDPVASLAAATRWLQLP